MPRKVIGGLIQAAAPLSDPAAPIAKVRQAAITREIIEIVAGAGSV